MHNSATCELCISSNDECTNGFPRDRRRCIRCNSISSSCPTQDAPESVSNHSVYCRNITDTCAVIYHESDEFSQKCASEMAHDEKEYCTRYADRCAYCVGNNNCNLKTNQNSKPTTITPNATTREIQTERPSSATQPYVNHVLLVIFIVFSVS